MPDGGFTVCDQAGNGKRHSDTMIVPALDLCSLERSLAGYGNAVLELFNLSAHAFQPLGHCGDAVRFLDPQFLGSADNRGSLSLRGENAEDREFVDCSGNLALAECYRTETRGRCTNDVSDRSPDTVRALSRTTETPMEARISSIPVLVGFTPTLRMVTDAFGAIRRPQ